VVTIVLMYVLMVIKLSKLPLNNANLALKRTPLIVKDAVILKDKNIVHYV